jgi:hypothetical protein
MELKVDLRQPVEKSAGSLRPSHLWVPGLALDDEGSLVAPGRRHDSYLAECECPNDCLRDHENE